MEISSLDILICLDYVGRHEILFAKLSDIGGFNLLSNPILKSELIRTGAINSPLLIVNQF